jgi:phosphohistidine phosphatase
MKTVYFVRHAKSSWDQPALRDAERPLNQRGLRDAPFMAKLMHGRGVQPDLLLSSPAVRAWSTAKFFAEALGVAEAAIQRDKRIYEAYPEELLGVLQELPDDVGVVFLFGHNPGLTSVANFFAEEYILNIPTCGIFRVDAAIDSWTDFRQGKGRLSELHYPKQYFN